MKNILYICGLILIECHHKSKSITELFVVGLTSYSVVAFAVIHLIKSFRLLFNNYFDFANIH